MGNYSEVRAAQIRTHDTSIKGPMSNYFAAGHCDSYNNQPFSNVICSICVLECRDIKYGGMEVVSQL